MSLSTRIMSLLPGMFTVSLAAGIGALAGCALSASPRPPSDAVEGDGDFVSPGGGDVLGELLDLGRPDADGGPSPEPGPGGEAIDGGSGAGDDSSGSDDIAIGEAPGPLPVDPDRPDEGDPDVPDEIDPPDIDDDQFQAGLLTAGAFDDNLNFAVFQDFMQRMLDAPARMLLPGFDIGRRMIIKVEDTSGAPVPDARVTITAAADVADQVQPAVDQTTRADGRVLLLTGLDEMSAAEEYVVTVFPPDGGPSVTETFDFSREQWSVVLPQATGTPPAQLDLTFVVDATGSMSDELEFLKAEVENIALSVADRFPEIDQRYALVVYRDEGDEYLTRTFDFTVDLALFQDDLADQSASGGGDYPEAMHLGLEEAAGLSWRQRDTARVLFLIADAPPHLAFGQRTFDAVQALRGLSIGLYPVAASGVAEEAEAVMRAASMLTLSQYIFLTDDSGVGSPHAEPHIPCYHVEPLEQIMIRMISSELRGIRSEPAPSSIIRTVGNPQDGVCMPTADDQQEQDDMIAPEQQQ